MKDYLIWLFGGNCIDGTAEEKELLDVKTAWMSYKCNSENALCEFNDSDGITIIDFSQVQAIGINNLNKDKDLGF